MDRLKWVAMLVLVAAGCRARAEAVEGEARLQDLVRERMPAIERIVGLKFKRVPAVAQRTREQVGEYIKHKLDTDLPPAEFAGAEAAYKRFGLIPDSMNLRARLMALLNEQVAGYYDPDSGTLFIPVGLTDSFALRTTVTHELVHALQDQYSNLDSVTHQKRANDRRSAAQAVLEGQATLVQTLVMMPELNVETVPSLWDARNAVLAQQSGMKEFTGAPIWLRETLVFPYMAGADFIAWFSRSHHGQVPYGALMPTSTSQILHPERYAAHDRPVGLAFAHPSADGVRYEDNLGEFETRLLFQQLLGIEAEAEVLASGWAGDRYAVLGHDADALVWVSVWQDSVTAARFAGGLKRAWAKRAKPGFTARIESFSLGGHPAVRLVDAPAGWRGWSHIPLVQIVNP